MSENVLMGIKSETSCKNPLRVWLEFLKTFTKAHSLQRYVGIHARKSRTNSSYTIEYLMRLFEKYFYTQFRDLRVTEETNVSTRNYLKYLTLLMFTNNSWRKKKMDV